ncbi:MAG TPA: S8 family serine peptidase [Roseateles sp.]
MKATSSLLGSRKFALRACALGALLMTTGAAHAGSPIPPNLSGALHGIAAKKHAAAAPKSLQGRKLSLTAAASDEVVDVSAESLLRDESGRVLVTVLLNGNQPFDQTRAAVAAVPGMTVTSEDRTYRSGALEGFVSEDALIALAKTPGVSAVHGQSRPRTGVGSTDSQGLVQHKISQLPSNLNGTGITIGVLSDSYNTAQNFVAGGALTVREAQDIASCDLPGPGNPCGNNMPVVVLKDMGTYPNASATDEGRAMAQLIHDAAPKARLGFATAFDGEVAFANNIRALAGIQGLPNSRPDFAAQVIVDDVQYFDEGMFADTIVAQAVDDVAALGVAYFSSAGNTPPTQGYASDFRYVPVAGATAGTNINLTNVPPALYAGGFHNFRTDGGQDIAQTITLGTSASGAARVLQMMFQWDDPYDTTPQVLGPVVQQVPGALTASVSSFDVPFSNPTAGAAYQVDVQGDSTTGGPGNFDAVVTIIAPDGSVVETVDTGFAEKFTFFATQAGTYTVRVQGFGNDKGSFTVTVNQVSGTQRVTTDFNLLFFRTSNGAYLGSVAENNIQTNRPLENVGLQFPTGNTQVQMVIARGNVPTAARPASRLRYVTHNGGNPSFPAEYFSYSTPITYGHNSAAGANGVAAYSPFLPNIPEDFTSTGPVRIVWDRNNNLIPEDQQVRLRPNIAAMDGGNTTFFISDTSRDLDSFPNFFGTSAAAPTAASIAALVLQNKGGPGSVTPAQMRTLLQNSTFAHDLDPYSATGTATTASRGRVTVTLNGDNSALAKADPNAFTVAYTGPGSIASITFDATNANPGGGNVVVPSTPGLVFDVRAASTGQPFVVGSGSVGLTAANVTATPSSPAPAPSVANMFFKLKLDFTAGAFTNGKALRFGVGRSTYRSAFVPPNGDSRAANSADLAGGVTRLPNGVLASGGITFTGTMADGSTFSGVLANRIGAGYSFLDGFGFIDATKAVNAPLQ